MVNGYRSLDKFESRTAQAAAPTVCFENGLSATIHNRKLTKICIATALKESEFSKNNCVARRLSAEPLPGRMKCMMNTRTPIHPAWQRNRSETA